MSTGIKKYNVQLSEVNVENFHKYFPKGNLSWALDLLLEKFTSQFTVTPDELAQKSVEEFREEQEI